jgi:hypothetical protein
MSDRSAQNREYYQKNKERLRQKRRETRKRTARPPPVLQETTTTIAAQEPLEDVGQIRTEPQSEETQFSAGAVPEEEEEPFTEDDLRQMIREEVASIVAPRNASNVEPAGFRHHATGGGGGLDLSIVIPLIGVSMFCARNPAMIGEVVRSGIRAVSATVSSAQITSAPAGGSTESKKTTARQVTMEELTSSGSL